MEVEFLTSPEKSMAAPVAKRDKVLTQPTFSLRPSAMGNVVGGAPPSVYAPTPQPQTQATPNYSDIVRSALQGIPKRVNDPMSLLADAMRYLVDGIQTTIANTSTLCKDMTALKSGQAVLAKRVDKLESGENSALDLATAADTHSKGCEPYTLASTGIPVHPNSLTRDFLMQIGAGIGEPLMLIWSRSFGTRQPAPPLGTNKQVHLHV